MFTSLSHAIRNMATLPVYHTFGCRLSPLLCGLCLNIFDGSKKWHGREKRDNIGERHLTGLAHRGLAGV